ncbi:restriction endonuclease subunit S [Snodgrassella sp. ESL0323]|uniref:restriction endonuclease subunit S n=1 Tax=Snodgrassella sp. ESL0323 TaxID=2705034 RepID=UPI001583105A|nr:restriction endonuclease subunit S [Snodgrassella sp. ESL0323]NUF79112.1 restriction endonuclease subunit S [Snodgrassella sp. ESL0323]
MNKDSWEVMQLCNLCDSINGLWKGKKEPFIKVGVIRNTNFTKDCKLDSINIEYLEVEEKQYSSRKLFFGDLILEKSGGGPKQPVGRIVPFEILEGDFSFSNFTSVLRIKDQRIIFYKFLYMFLLHFYRTGKTEKLQSNTTGIRNLDLKAYKSVSVPLPPLPIQKKIVKELDTLSDIITKKKEQLAELDKLAQATFYDMFGDPIKNEKEWEMRRLEELGDWASGGTPLRSNLLYFKGSIPWVTSGELNSLFINDTIEHINEEAIRNSNAKLIRKGSLLLGMYDTAALKSSINKREMACNQAIAFSFINTKLCNTIYVYYSIQINKEEYKKEQRGIRQKNLNLSMIKAISILYPPLLLQNQFAEKIEAIEQQKALINQSITDTQLLFDYTMDKYFN